MIEMAWVASGRLVVRANRAKAYVFGLLLPRRYPLSDLRELHYGDGNGPSETVTRLHERVAEAIGIPYSVSGAGW